MNLAGSTPRSTSQAELPRPATVRTRMSRPAVTVSVDKRGAEIERLLEAQGISSVPVVDGDVVVGVVSSTDLLRAPVGEPRRASELMSSPAIIAQPDEALDLAAWRMVAARVHRLVVVDRDQRPVGVLAAYDVLEELVSRRIEDPIAAVMSSPVEAIDIGDPIDDAIARLASTNVHGLVVVDGLSPVGVFTHTEALASRRLTPALRARPVEEVMSADTSCLNVATPIRRAAAYALATKARRLLVVQSRHLVGIVSPLDLIGVLSRAPAG
jgi:CBS domain-containing protein